ncbi:MAG: hypothetical protein ABSB29_01130 [Nitrososphaerales archaeon]
MSEPKPLPAYCHINEYRTEEGAMGYSKLVTIANTVEIPILWSPSPTYMDELHAQSPKLYPMTSDDLLEYVKDGYIRIAGRFSWYDDPKSRAGTIRRTQATWMDRKTGKSHAEWKDGFDDKIRKIAEKEERRHPKWKDRLERKVIRVHPARGKEEVKKKVIDGSHIVNEELYNEILSYIDKKLFPGAMLQRIEGLSDPLKVASVYENISNHEFAVRETNSKCAVYPWEEAQRFFGLEARKRFGLSTRGSKSAEEAAHEIDLLVKLLERIEPYQSLENFDRIIRSHYAKELRRFFSNATSEGNVLNQQDPLKALVDFSERCVDADLAKYTLDKKEVRKKLEYVSMDAGVAALALGVFLRADMNTLESLTGMVTVAGLGSHILNARESLRSLLVHFGLVEVPKESASRPLAIWLTGKTDPSTKAIGELSLYMKHKGSH